MLRRASAVSWISVLIVGCGLAPPDARPEEKAHGAPLSRAPSLVQPGEDLLLLAVSADDFALYQDGQTVYATKLAPNAVRTKVADVPGTNIAFPLQVGRVVFLWTDPQRNLPGFGVSPLVLWTSDQGPRLISPVSAVGLVATAASSDGRQIVFTTNVTPDGLRGDLVHAWTRDALSPRTLLRDIPLDFPFGRCRPLAGFAGAGDDAFPIAAACAAGDSTATVSRWEGTRKVDLVSNVATPMPFTLETDPQGRTLLLDLATGAAVKVTTSGQVTTLDTGVAPPMRGFVNRQGDALYTAPSASGSGRELRLSNPGRSPRTLGPIAFLYSNSYNRGGYFQSRISSPDGTLALFGSTSDPNTGLTDMNLVNVSTGTVSTLDGRTLMTVGSELFTSDSRFAVYFELDDLNFGTGPIFAASRTGATHRIGSGTQVFDVLRATGSKISLSQSPTFDPGRQFQLSTADLLTVDVATGDEPKLVSAQASLFYLPSDDRRRLIFTSKTEPEGHGLYVATVP